MLLFAVLLIPHDTSLLMTMDPLSFSASITTLVQLAGTVIRYLSNVRDGPKELQRIRIEVSSVLGILFLLQEQSDQVKQGDSFTSTLRSLDVPNGPLEQFRIALECIASKIAPVKGWEKLGKTLKWPFEKEEIQTTLNTIERQKALFSLALQHDHFALSRAIQGDIENIREGVNKITEEFTNLQMGGRSKKIHQWLSAPDPSSNHSRALKHHYANTGDWFLKSDIYLDWLSNPGALLWLFGIPGCGKTILSSTIIQRTISECQIRTNPVVLYFYFDFNDVQKQQPENLVRSLIVQLSSQCANLSPALESLYSSCNNGERQPAYDMLLTALNAMMTCFAETYLVLDALDECLERRELLTSIGEIASWKDANVHILTTSRREKDIEESMEPLCGDHGKICVQSTLVNNDIRAYIQGRLHTDRDLKKWQNKPGIEQKIEDTLMEKADGM